jgi:WD40 repeat protein
LERDDCETTIKLLKGIQTTKTNNGEIIGLLKFAEQRLTNSNRLIKSINATGDIYGDISLSGDDRLLLVGSSAGTPRIWDITTNKCLGKLNRPYPDCLWLDAVTLSYDGRFALYRGKEDTLMLWDVDTGFHIRSFPGNEYGFISKDSQFVLSGSKEKTIKLWDLHTGECLKSFQDCGYRCISYSGDKILALGESALNLWDIHRGVCLRSFPGRMPGNLSQDGRFVISGGEVNTLQLWDANTGKLLRIFHGHSSKISSVCFSNDGNFVLSASSDRTIKIWNVNTGVCLRSLKGHTSWVWSVCLSHHENFLVSSGDDKTIRVWKINYSFNYPAPQAISRISSSESLLTGQSIYERNLAKAKTAISQSDYQMAAQYLRDARLQPGYMYAKEAIEIWGSLYQYMPRQSVTGFIDKKTFQHYTSATCISKDGKTAISVFNKISRKFGEDGRFIAKTGNEI